MPAGLAAIHDSLGRSSLADVLEVAAEVLDRGPEVSHHVYSTWAADDRDGYVGPLDRLNGSPAATEIYGAGVLPRPGTRLTNPDYASTLRHLGAAGFDDFYRGDIADRIATDFGRNDGVLGRSDLEEYSAGVGAALASTYGPFEVRTTPYPSLSGRIGEALGSLEGHELGSMDPLGPDYVASVASALVNEGDAALAALIGKHTTHIICVDDDDNVVTMTHSLGAASGVVTPGLGFMFNGAMHRFDPRPGRPTSIRPGEPRPSGIAPTILTRNGVPQLVAGGAGGLGIVQGIVQVILRIVEYGHDAPTAVSSPRFSVYGRHIRLEAGYPSGTAIGLRRAGFEVTQLPDALDRHHVGRVILASRINDVEWQAAADPRGGGIAVRT
jgi:gamma-glutamyltranspeptidase/glutathione hydrolase